MNPGSRLIMLAGLDVDLIVTVIGGQAHAMEKLACQALIYAISWRGTSALGRFSEPVNTIG
jgi:hypothetical protein